MPGGGFVAAYLNLRAVIRGRIAVDDALRIGRPAAALGAVRRHPHTAIFGQQCELSGETVVVKTKTGGDCVQNPSDLDATYDGHKGPGYQVQITETCAPSNAVDVTAAAQR